MYLYETIADNETQYEVGAIQRSSALDRIEHNYCIVSRVLSCRPLKA